NTPAPTDYEPAPATGSTPEDDLKVVEGIGPKIESVLKASGITTLDTLATTSIERLREVLDAAGSRFKSHDPKTWPVQAGLAADGKLAELKAWQQELK
ncbi:MAG: 50S ribosomal protein L21, partial [Bacteroidota bacterium]